MTPIEPRATTFRINDVTAIEATIVAAERPASGVAAGVRLTIELTPSAWERADLLMLFHLDWSARLEGTVSGDAPVQVDLRLDAEAVSADELPDDPEQLAAAVAGASDDSPLRAETSWWALAVTEALDLPPELAAKGEVRTGFTTTWANAE